MQHHRHAKAALVMHHFSCPFTAACTLYSFYTAEFTTRNNNRCQTAWNTIQL